MYNALYQYTNDIDWFFLYGNVPVHVASNGGLLPNNIYRAVDLQSLQTAIENMDDDCEFELNMPALNYYVRRHYEGMNEFLPIKAYNVDFPEGTEAWVKAYAWSFARMAKRGFYSFDRSADTGMYFLVCKPKKAPANVPDIVNDLIFRIEGDNDNILHNANGELDNLGSQSFPLVKWINTYQNRQHPNLRPVIE